MPHIHASQSFVQENKGQGLMGRRPVPGDLEALAMDGDLGGFRHVGSFLCVQFGGFKAVCSHFSLLGSLGLLCLLAAICIETPASHQPFEPPPLKPAKWLKAPNSLIVCSLKS